MGCPASRHIISERVSSVIALQRASGLQSNVPLLLLPLREGTDRNETV